MTDKDKKKMYEEMFSKFEELIKKLEDVQNEDEDAESEKDINKGSQETVELATKLKLAVTPLLSEKFSVNYAAMCALCASYGICYEIDKETQLKCFGYIIDDQLEQYERNKPFIKMMKEFLKS